MCRSKVQWLSMTALACLVLAAWLVTGRAAWLSHAYLPMGDILRYADALQAGAEGRILWPWLWERHNGFHFMPLPKLVFLLDMRLTAGSGWLVMACSASLWLLGLWIFLQCIFCRMHFSGMEKVQFSLVAAVLIGSATQLESLANPINIQWSFLSVGFLLTASAWPSSRGQPFFWGRLLSGVAVSIGSAGPWAAMLAGFFLVFLWGRVGGCGWRRVRFALLGFAGLLFLLECFNRFLWQQPPLFLWLYRWTTNDADWLLLTQAVMLSPWQFWLHWFVAQILFLSQFWSVPFGIGSPLWLSPVLAVFIITALWLLWRRGACPAVLRGFSLYLLALVFLLALMAALARPVAIYTPRFANIGLLGMLVFWLWLFQAVRQSGCAWVRHGVPIAMACTVFLSGIASARDFPFSMNDTRAAQLAYAVGLTETEAIVNDPHATWADIDARDTRHFIAQWRQQALGIFASASYRRFVGSTALPLVEVDCEHRVERFRQRSAQGVYLRGSSRSHDGEWMTQVIFVDDRGMAIGYGIPHVPHAWHQQWQKRVHWQAWVGKEAWAASSAVRLVAYDSHQRCAPWVLPFPIGQ